MALKPANRTLGATTFMPEIKKFTIRNYKGIEQTSIALDDRTNNPIITLIGLNESGKTTILEALSYFVSSDKLVSSLFKGNQAKTNTNEIIPINRRSAFTDSIEIEAVIKLDEDDINQIASLAENENLYIDKERLSKSFTLTKELMFEDSILVTNSDIWDADLRVRKKGESEFIECEPGGETENFWRATMVLIQEVLPSLAYFPTFLVDIPNKIYLQEHENETAANRHYRSIFQSIMEGIDDGLDLEKHVSRRISAYANNKPNGNWPAQFVTSAEKSLIDAVFKKASNSVTKEVIGGWRRVFSKDSSAKQMSITWNIDTSKGNIPYASFLVSDGEYDYEISERSLGFRWFFSFLLFTAFKGESNKASILIFDEPAANLHAKAQAELLKSFEKIATNGTKIIYSTHSHHMINPKWLGGAYIVENTALNPEEEDNFDFSSNPTNIKATKYKEFLSNYPSRSSYFQPVIESLDYVVPELIGTPPYVLVEGISDYYALTIAQKISKINLHFRILPGVGSGASGPLISLMMGRGEHFLVLLDDDSAGQKECARYKAGWFLPEATVFTLATVNEKFSGMALERLIDSSTIDIIKSHYESSVSPSKKQIGWYLSEACAKTEVDRGAISINTLNSLVEVLEFLNSRVRPNIGFP
ncbi:AAA family ATPase [Pseudomonas sp. PDM10]|uniref:ATP-dependent nuclease n=1 Tax=Pseudomonas sp. PDM10 TaxID=2769269 RepID=UPI0017836B28|nr:AAA family ATPase [Pseudomonas sp. PDM10]MBD9601502.1 AAA family ATPase [Pseudomonas sp. PDM10]